MGRLVDLIARVLEAGGWEGAGIRSAEQWVAWKCGESPARARSVVAMARRVAGLPDTKTAMNAGELCEDQVAVICRYAPAGIDSQAAELARSATVVQLRRVLGSYAFETDKAPGPPAAVEVRRANFGHDDKGSSTLSAQLTADKGALVERALAAARDELYRASEHGPGAKPAPADVSWADALVAMAERSLAPGAECRPHHERHLVLLHVDTDPDGAPGGHLHLGPGLSDGLRRFLSCDVRIRPVIEAEGRPVSVGRAFRTVPDRTRMDIEERHRGCRFPGCERSRWLHIHHVEHWEDGGSSDTANLLALCQRHTALTTSAVSASAATPTTRTGSSSPTSGVGESTPPAVPRRPAGRRERPPAPWASPPADGHTPPGSGSIRRGSS